MASYCPVGRRECYEYAQRSEVSFNDKVAAGVKAQAAQEACDEGFSLLVDGTMGICGIEIARNHTQEAAVAAQAAEGELYA